MDPEEKRGERNGEKHEEKNEDKQNLPFFELTEKSWVNIEKEERGGGGGDGRESWD
jgi:hypothetical protein